MCGLSRWLLSILFLAPVVTLAQAADLNWNQDLETSELVALAHHQPVVVAFIGNDKWDPTIFNKEPLDSLTGKALFVWVGADLSDQTMPDQIAIEKQFNITRLPTFILLVPFQTGLPSKGGTPYNFRESMRCVEAYAPGQCAAIISSAVSVFETRQKL